MMLAPMRLFHERPLTRMFDEMFCENAAARWVPALDIDENEDAWVVTAELPGIDPNAVEITLDGRELTIRGEKVAEKKDEKVGRRYAERRYGAFERRFTLPDHIDTEAIEASMVDGVLELKLPKKAEVAPKKITVKAA